MIKEILVNIYTNIIFYKVNYINKYYIIYSKNNITKLNLKYFIKYIMQNNINFNKFKINIIKKDKYNKYIIYF